MDALADQPASTTALCPPCPRRTFAVPVTPAREAGGHTAPVDVVVPRHGNPREGDLLGPSYRRSGCPPITGTNSIRGLVVRLQPSAPSSAVRSLVRSSGTTAMRA
jgi:hypothetical protein